MHTHSHTYTQVVYSILQLLEISVHWVGGAIEFAVS